MKFNGRSILITLSILSIAGLVFIGYNSPTSSQKPEPSIKEPGQPLTAKEAGSVIPELTQPTSEDSLDMLLPDLKVEPLKDAYIVSVLSGPRTLRFPGTFANIGDGPLEMIGAHDEKNGTTTATQIIYQQNGLRKERFAGSFAFHPTHKHWHFENFVEFGIFSLNNEKIPDQSMADTGKITYCLHDYAPLENSYPGKPDGAVYPWCDDAADRQGISVGWVDTYLAEVPGQELDITSLTDGIYAFQSRVDPDNLILEKDENNNTTLTYFELSGNQIKVLNEPPE